MDKNKYNLLDWTLQLIIFWSIVLLSFSILYVFEMSNHLVSKVHEQEKEILILENSLINNVIKEQSICEAYSNLDKVQMEYRDNTVYYFVNGLWYSQEILWESCLSK